MVFDHSLLVGIKMGCSEGHSVLSQLKCSKILGKYFCQNPGTGPRSSDSWVAAVKAVLVLLVCCVQTSGKESVGRRLCDLEWKCNLLTEYTTQETGGK